jgi:Tfp pilus assembly protein PilZ
VAAVPSRPEKLPPAPAKAKPPAVGKFDKAFPVFLEGDRGVAAGVGRNITDTGMFVETREPFPLGTRVRVTFTSPHGGAEMTLEGEVRYQCFINFARPDATRSGMRGVGLRFVEPAPATKSSRGTVH